MAAAHVGARGEPARMSPRISLVSGIATDPRTPLRSHAPQYALTIANYSTAARQVYNLATDHRFARLNLESLLDYPHQ